ncbi:MAG: methyltransferase domain-containing protein [Dehalococcoidia bacterium]|nr:methyltransferase domain-containing protein [Dehalococcoidia bacterium]
MADEVKRADAPQTAGRTIRSWARFYDAASWLLSFGRSPAIRRMTVEMAAVAPGEAVLDVGCGTGSLAIALKANVGESGDVRGIDASPEMIEQARRKAAGAGVDAVFEVALIEKLPFPEARFDLVVSSFMLHHLPNDVKRNGLAEIRRVLKPGGRFLAVDFGGTSQSVIGHLLSIFGHTHGAGLDALAPVMAETGFADVEAGLTKYRSVAYLRGKAPS